MEEQELAGLREDLHALPADMPQSMARLIVAIDAFSNWVGRVVAWLTVPLMLSMAYEVFARYLFTAPTTWAYDISRMLYGAMFVLGAAYGLSKGVHIRADFIYRKWSVQTQGKVDLALYLVCFFPSMLILLYVSTDWAWTSVSRLERGMDTAWMPYLGPIKSCLPVGVAFLILQGISETLKCVHAARKGRWPQ